MNSPILGAPWRSCVLNSAPVGAALAMPGDSFGFWVCETLGSIPWGGIFITQLGENGVRSLKVTATGNRLDRRNSREVSATLGMSDLTRDFQAAQQYTLCLEIMFDQHDIGVILPAIG